MAFEFLLYPAKVPNSFAISADVAYALICIIAVSAPQIAKEVKIDALEIAGLKAAKDHLVPDEHRGAGFVVSRPAARA